MEIFGPAQVDKPGTTSSEDDFFHSASMNVVIAFRISIRHDEARRCHPQS